MIGSFLLFSFGLGFGSGVVLVVGDSEMGGVAEPLGSSGNAEIGEAEGDDGGEDWKRAVRGCDGVQF